MGELGLTEDQLDVMSLRTFHNLLTGRHRKEQAERKLESIRHSELLVTILSPHMKKKDRDAAYKEIEKEARGLVPEAPKKAKKDVDPVEFWNRIDGKVN